MKGQAAMEYLMTYGWALLVIVIVIAILLIINPFSAPQGCRFDQTGFTCNNPVVDTDAKLFMSVTNGNNNAIKVCDIYCTGDRSPQPPAFSQLTNLRTDKNCTGTEVVILRRQESLEVSGFYGTSAVKPLTCKGPDGVSTASLTAGSEFSGKVWIFYKNEEDGPDYPIRTVSANVVTKAVAKSS
ncbi:Uncharacterised protein [uncultured archaeon]|nr:Uncharacterised protein [uncultured archaeon]